MLTIRSWVSDIRTSFKLISGDNLISDRMIASELLDVATKLIKQQTDKRKLFFTDTLFTELPCLQMVKTSLAECCDYVSECYIARSQKKIPKIAENIHGLLYKGVFTIDRKSTFTYVDVERYVNLLKLYPGKSFRHFWISGGYLYISDPHIERVSLVAFFEEPVDPILYHCSDIENLCPTNPLDLEFKCPGYLKDDIKRIVRDNLMRTYKQSQDDKTHDNNDTSL